MNFLKESTIRGFISEDRDDTTVFPVTGRQLYLGEGDFSFTLCLRMSGLLPDTSLVTCFSDQLTVTASNNASQLRQSGIEVCTGVDATCLASYAQVIRHRYDYIIFNFPHTGVKIKIDKCRELLRRICRSAAPLLSESGQLCVTLCVCRQLWVTLCQGQGGTGGELVARRWADSWQLTEQAAAARLVLHRLAQFRPECFAGYCSTGNRGREARPFHSRRGMTHVLTASPVDSVPLTLSTLLQRATLSQCNCSRHTEQQQQQQQSSLVWSIVDVEPFPNVDDESGEINNKNGSGSSSSTSSSGNSSGGSSDRWCYQLCCAQYWQWRIGAELLPPPAAAHPGTCDHGQRASAAGSDSAWPLTRHLLRRLLAHLLLPVAGTCDQLVYLRWQRRMYALTATDASGRGCSDCWRFERAVSAETPAHDWCCRLPRVLCGDAVIVYQLDDDKLCSGRSDSDGCGSDGSSDPLTVRLVTRHCQPVSALAAVFLCSSLQQAGLHFGTVPGRETVSRAVFSARPELTAPLLTLSHEEAAVDATRPTPVCVFNVQAMAAHWLFSRGMIDAAATAHSGHVSPFDWRLLSRCDLVLCSLDSAGSVPVAFYSLFPPLHQLDLSFWIGGHINANTTSNSDEGSCAIDCVNSAGRTSDICHCIGHGGRVWCYECAERRVCRCLRAALRHMLVSVLVLDRYCSTSSNANNKSSSSSSRSDVNAVGVCNCTGDVSCRDRTTDVTATSAGKQHRHALTLRLIYQCLDGPLSFEQARRLHVDWLPQVLAVLFGYSTR